MTTCAMSTANEQVATFGSKRHRQFGEGLCHIKACCYRVLNVAHHESMVGDRKNAPAGLQRERVNLSLLETLE